MKNKRKRKLHSYIMFLCAFCIVLGLLWDNVKDFFIGFFAGWNEMSDLQEARIQFENMGQILGWGILGIGLLSICVCCYKQLRKRVTGPIERLAMNMNQVKDGDFTVRTPIDGNFEIVDMQDAFNSMVQELEDAKKIREITEHKNQQLYAGIAHDLKTPMTIVLGYAKLLERSNVSDDARKRYIKTIIEQTEHTNALLDSLLAYTRLENQSYQLKKERKDIVECLRECVANYYPMLEEADIQMELDLPDKEVIDDFDTVEMKRVFANLLTNMVKHNPSKTSCIIRLEESSNEETSKKKICIIVADNGPKIPSGLHSAIFDSFVVGDDSRNTKNGSGLGLSISKKIIERHGGRLSYIDDWQDDYKCFMVELYI